MLTVWGKPTGRNCDGTTRRDFLRVGTLGLAGLSLPGLLRARADYTAAGKSTSDTAVVLLWLPGGPTHMDTYDLKPQAPAEYRGEFRPIATNVPGIEICELMPQQAKVMDKMAIVRSFSHTNAGHGGGTHWVMTGFNYVLADSGAGPVNPSPGAVCAKVRGNNPKTGMPPFIALNRVYADGPAHLGVASAPFEAGGQAKQNMSLPGGITLERLDDRRALLKGFDKARRDLDSSGTMNGLDSFEQQAFNLILSKEARDAFDISREDAKIRERYGKGLGEQLLVSRRLVEAGASFVNVAWGGWDHHGQVANGMRAQLPPLDHALATFAEDTYQRGLSQNILLVMAGEFGRTPRVNVTAGRDHWPTGMFAVLVGGGLKMGQVIGETNARGEVPRTRPVTPQDLMATIYHVLGIDRDLRFLNGAGRPTAIVEQGQPIPELV
ncbi:MAG: DUF1501 domain-containing protein [Planctomycetes bacterium]|nr:DUF1501 domain-containing protein [Planctomycetota bacterium]